MLHSGNLFDFTEPASNLIDIEDIAHGLAHTCRYAGQCRVFYSVAEHSVHVSHVVEHAKLAGLLHDAAEAFVGDMAKPLKMLIPMYSEIEDGISRAIFRRFNLDWPMASEVKMADYSVMAKEQESLMPPGTNSWIRDARVMPADIEVLGLDPNSAKELFLERYSELVQSP